ncbi:MAG: FAD-binding oxidoreductase [Ferrimicrobium sp.]
MQPPAPCATVAVTAMEELVTTQELLEELTRTFDEESIVTGDAIAEEFTHDEALTATPIRPLAVVFPRTTDQVALLVTLARKHKIPLTARGGGTGLSGGAVPSPRGIVCSFARMRRIVDIDVDNSVAVVQPGVTLATLEAALEPYGLVYPVYPGELSATLGGNVATNAGGMRAIKYGVTRHNVLGLEFVAGSGSVIRTGGKYVKSSSGYDLTQLIIGSEGTLGLVTEATLRLHQRQDNQATLLVPFVDLSAISGCVPSLLATGIVPTVLEYLDASSLFVMAKRVGLELGIADSIRDSANAYLFIIVEALSQASLEEAIDLLTQSLITATASEVYLLPERSATKLLEARESAFWVSKEMGANDILDVVVPRGSIPRLMEGAYRLAAATSSRLGATGHVGDGNIHFSLFQPDPQVRHRLVMEILELGQRLGGSISAEHGIGSEKRDFLSALEDPIKLGLYRSIKRVFDPDSILNPSKVIT